MELKVNVQDLLDAMNTVTRALAARPSKAILEGVQLAAAGDELTLLCSDGSLTIESVITAQVKDGGCAVMPGKLFNELVRKLPGGEVNLKFGDRYEASITCSSFKSSLMGMNPNEFPEMAHAEYGTKIRIQQNRLREMINRTVFAIATDETRRILTGCLLEVTRSNASLVALDGYRLAIQNLSQPFELPEGKDVLKAVIPGRVLSELSKILPDEETFCELMFDKNHMQASFGNTKLNTVLLSGEFIDYRRILPGDFKTETRVSRRDLSDAIDRASLMAREGKNNLIRMSFTQDTLNIASKAEMGDMRETIGCQLFGDPIEIAFNAKYLTDVIRNVQDDELVIKFNTNVSPCVFTPLNGDNFLYLILPVRVFQ